MSVDHHFHDTIYATPGLPAFEYSAMTDRLFAGRNPLTAVDVRRLAEQEQITHLLDLREPHEWSPPKFGMDALTEIERLGLHRLHLPVTDMGAPTATELDLAVAHLSQIQEDPRAKVYVHCRAGMERTAAVLIAYHARTHGVSYDEALSTLRRRRPILAPLRDQALAVRRWLETR